VGVAPNPSLRRFAPPWSARWPALADLWRALGAAASAERERWALWLPVALGAGIGLYFALPFEPAATVGLGFGVAGVLVAIVAAGSKAPLRSALALVAAAAIGFAAAKARTESVAAPVLSHRMGPVHVWGTVEAAGMHGKGTRAVLALDTIGHRPARAVVQRVRVSFRVGGDILDPGRRVQALVVLMPPPGPAAPGDYDFGRAAYYMGLGAVGYAYGRPVAAPPVATPNLLGRIALFVERLRFRMSARIHAVLPGSTGAIASALITGDRGGIAQDDEQALRDAGLAHVLAIAGLHMALVGLGLFWAVRAFLALFPAIALTQPIKKWAAVAALLGSAFYLVISGAAAPAIRAFTMLAMMLLAMLADRQALSMRSVALAAALILSFEPESLVEPGFQMSFAAVAALIAVAEWAQAHRRETAEAMPLRAVWRYVRGIAATSFIGSLATLPYAIYHFDRATHYAVLGNLLAMPIMGLITMPAAAASVMLMPFGLDAAPLHAMGLGIDAMLAVGRWVSSLPGAVTAVPATPLAALVLISLGGVWMAIWRRNWRWFGAVPAAAGIAVALLARPPDILVSREGDTVAVRGDDGALRLMRKPKDKYSAEEWLKRDGDVRAPEAAVGGKGIRCDAYGCVARLRGGVLVAESARIEGLAEDCAMATIVIAATPAHDLCHGPTLVIDRLDVWRDGAYALWLDGPVRVETVQQQRGDRPWSAPSRSRVNTGG